MNNGSTCEKVFCPTYTHLLDYLHHTQVITHPKKVLIHCGTNDVEKKGFIEKNFEDTFIKAIFKLQELFPSSQFIISGILPRREISLNMFICNLNDFVAGCCSTLTNFTYMNNRNITKTMLDDNKHVDRKGFSILLSNIRQSMFSIIPKR